MMCLRCEIEFATEEELFQHLEQEVEAEFAADREECENLYGVRE
jgi:hypothetical protein